MKQVRKAVRTFLINDNKVIVIKYKTNKNMGYYDIPGGKIEENESAIDASIREFKEEELKGEDREFIPYKDLLSDEVINFRSRKEERYKGR